MHNERILPLICLIGALFAGSADAQGLMERLPPKIHAIQSELPAWIQRTGNMDAMALMRQLKEQIDSKDSRRPRRQPILFSR